MQHVLNNPIWHALNSGSSDFAFGNEQVKLCNRSVGLFAGMINYNEANFNWLYDNSAAGDAFILFTPDEIAIPANWSVKINRPMLQMVYLNPLPFFETDSELRKLTEAHVPQMLDLTQRTKPGPFLEKTILFGNYFGIFNKDQLVSMAGQRLQPHPYTEVSAVCTDPHYTGKGYAKKLMLHIMQIIINNGKVPMLHLYKDNTQALQLYYKLGFEVRSELRVYLITRE